MNSSLLPLDTIITFGKFKNKKLSELLADRNYAEWVLSAHKTLPPDLYHSINYYTEKRKLDQEPVEGGTLTYRVKSLMENRSFNDILTRNNIISPDFVWSRNIISEDFNNFVCNVHSVDPSMSGSFFDYLLRRVISDKIGVQFQDNRALALYKIFNSTRGISIGMVEISESFKNLFLYSFDKVTDNNIDICSIPGEIYIISVAHSILFQRYDEDIIYQQYEYIRYNFKYDYIQELWEIVENKGLNYDLNPVIGIRDVIDADADLIIDGNLFEIKVGKNMNYKYVFLQLLGYTSLLQLRETHIDKIYVINLHENVIGECDISYWKDSDRRGFLKYMGLDIKIPDISL